MPLIQKEAIPQFIDRLWQLVCQKKPVLGDIFDRFGNSTLSEYTEQFTQTKLLPYFSSRQKDLRSVVHGLVEKRISKKAADDFCEQLEQMPIVSTADHHAIIDHPYWVNSDIITALPFCKQKNNTFKYIPVFSFASISLNNASAYPRGIVLHGNGERAAEVGCCVPFFPDKMKMSVAYVVRPWTLEDIDRACGDICEKQKDGQWDLPYSNTLCDYAKRVFGAKDVLDMPDFCSQVTRVNNILWPSFFHGPSGEPDTQQTSFVAVEIETIVKDLLLQYHLQNKDSLLYNLFFDTKTRKVLEKYMDGLPGSYSISESSGSYLFWGLDAKMHRVALMEEGGYLVSKDGGIKVALTSEGLSEALIQKNIFPNMFLCYSIVAFYYGFTCIGGFSQVNDLTETKKAWQKWLLEIGKDDESQAVEPIVTNLLNASGIVMASLSFKGSIVPATGIDMALSVMDTRMEVFQYLAENATLREMFLPILPAAYKVFYTEAERDPELSSLTYSAIAEHTGLAQKVRDILHLN